MNKLMEKIKEEKALRGEVKSLKARRKQLKDELLNHRDVNTDEYNSKMKELRSIEENLDAKQDELDNKTEEVRGLMIEKNTRDVFGASNGVDAREKVLASVEYRDAFFRSLIADRVSEADREIMDYGKRESKMNGGSVQEGGEYLLPTNTIDKIYSVVENYGRVWRKVTKYGFTGVVSLPIGTPGQAAKNEDGSITLNYKFNETLIKQDAVVAKVEVKNILLKNSISALEAYLVSEIGKYIGTYLDYAVIHGDGKSFVGILEALAGKEQKYSTFDYDTICDIQGDVESPYGDEACWIMRRKSFFKVIKKIKDNAGKPITVELPITSGKGQERYIEGQEVIFTNAMQEGDFLFGDLNQFIANVSQDTVIEKSTQEAFSADKTIFRGKVYAGGSVVSNDIATAAFAFYVKDGDKVIAPTANPDSGAVATGTEVVLTTETADAKIRYTVDGTEVKANSKVYAGAIKITADTTIKARAFKSGMAASDEVTFNYTISQ